MTKTKQRRRKRNARGPLASVLLVVFIFSFAFSAYQILSILWESYRADRAYIELRSLAQAQPAPTAGSEAEASEAAVKETPAPTAAEKRKSSVDISELRKAYPEMSAWLYADGTGINYPVMQAADNQFYLTHLYDGSENIHGALFADYRNTGILTDDNTVIYGHNMRDGEMFHVLGEYQAQDFFETHPTMRITTEDGDYLIELISGTLEDGDYEFVRFSFENFEEMSAYVAGIRARSTFDSDAVLQPGDRLVSLCTCNYDLRNGRYMLLGRVAGTADEN